MTKEQIRALRKKMELNTKRFGDLFPVSFRTVEHWESGYRNPNPIALRILRELDK